MKELEFLAKKKLYEIATEKSKQKGFDGIVCIEKEEFDIKEWEYLQDSQELITDLLQVKNFEN